MKKLLIYFVSALIISFSGLHAQSIQFIDPANGLGGDVITISVNGIGTHFKAGLTSVNFSSGDMALVPGGLNIYSATTLSMLVKINDNAKTEKVNFTIVSGNEHVNYTGFSVTSKADELANGNIYANLEVMPTQTLYVSDFDASHLNTAPVLFKVDVTSFVPNKTFKGVTAILTLTGASFGTIITMSKTFDLASGVPVHFNNREFDKYDLNTNSKAFIDKALQNGMVPADVYTYSLTISQNKTTIAGPVTGTNIITNPGSGLELVSPGAPLNTTPEQITEKTPQLQWFSQLSFYDLYVYQVKPGQASGPDITSNTPVFYQTGLTGNSFLYPLSAMQLQQGYTYAWQVVGHSTGSHGDQKQYSEVYWFSIGAPADAGFATINKVEVLPADIEIDRNDTFQFTARAYDNKESLMNMKPIWSVVPAEGGKIDQNGLFVAGSNTMTVAIIAKYGNKEDYATVKINLGYNPWDFEAFFRQVFGLPGSSK